MQAVGERNEEDADYQEIGVLYRGLPGPDGAELTDGLRRVAVGLIDKPADRQNDGKHDGSEEAAGGQKFYGVVGCQYFLSISLNPSLAI